MKTKPFGSRATLALLLCLLITNIAGATSYTLTVSAQGSGSVAKNPTNASYPAGVVVTISATASNGWYFANWSGDANGIVNPLNVTMNANLVVTGNFLAYPTYTLSLATNGEGTIDLNPPGGSYLNSTIVTATATPAAGWVFVGWSGSTNTSDNPTALTMNEDRSLTGNFAQLPAFDVQPASVASIFGSTVSFSAHAVGTAPLGYQWFFSGGSLATVATNATLSLTNIGFDQAGNYWLVATNAYGRATSQVASLTLAGEPTNVVNSADEASLRAAIALGGWVGFGFNGTIALTNTINITRDVILDAKHVTATISGGNAVRLFYVAPGVNFSVTNLTLANGACLITNGTAGMSADGGAIYNDGGTVSLIGCTLSSNLAQAFINSGLARSGVSAHGGAIYNNSGTLLLDQTSCSNNSAIGRGYIEPHLYNLLGNGLGGAIYNDAGVVTIIGCNVSGNLCSGVNNAGRQMMGGAVFQSSGTMLIADSSFSLNRAVGEWPYLVSPTSTTCAGCGGAVAVSAGSLSIGRSLFSGNQAIGCNGGSAVYDNEAGPGYGGAVYCLSEWVVTDSTFSGNQAIAGDGSYYGIGIPHSCGGGIYNGGSLAINRCSVYSNLVRGGAGTPSMWMASDGGDGLGGGIFNAAQINAINCTIALNAAISGAGLFLLNPLLPRSGNALGGGVFNDTTATFTAMNLTIASNRCNSPSYSGNTNTFAAGYQIANTNGTLRLHNSLVAYSGTNSNTYGPITDDGYNICSDGSANLFSGSSYNFTDPKLGPLADYGGPTPSMVLLTDSPAIDGGDPVAGPSTDQRGRNRPFGTATDIGAFESSPPFIVQGNVSGITNLVILSAGTTNIAMTNSGFYRFTTLPAGACVIAPSNANYVFVPNSRPFTNGPDQLDADFKAFLWNTVNIDGTANSTVHLIYAGTNGQTYRVFNATTLTSPWLPVATNTLVASNYFELFLPMSGEPLQFYRAVTP